MKNRTKLVLATFLVGILASVQAQLTVSHDFNDGRLEPFESCTTQSPNYVRVVNNRVKTWWTSQGYNGTRMDKGAEFCGHELGEWLTYKEGWCGVKVTLGSDYPKNKTAGIAQIMGRFLDIEWSTWSGEISIENGDLVVSHRSGAGSSNTVHRTVYENFPYEEEVDLVMHFVLSQENRGELEFWVNGVSSYKATNINFGLGEFRNDQQVPGLSRTIFKLGQYNYESDDYDNNETRTVYYDDVTWYSGGSEGYDIVNPGSGGNTNTGGSTDIELIASGVAGNNTNQMLSRIGSDVLNYNPNTTILLAGTNDMINSSKLNSFDAFETNLRNIANQINNRGSDLLFMTIPPCVEATLFQRHDESAFDPYGPNGRITRANARIQEVAADFNAPVVDLYSVFNNNMSLMSSDGVHPTNQGYQTIVDLIYDALERYDFTLNTIVCFGDSITRGYADTLREELEDNPIDGGGNGGTVVTGDFTPDPSKTYYLDVPHHDVRLAANGSSEDPYTASTSTTGSNVEWRFVAAGDMWHLRRAAGGAKPGLRTDNSASADMQETSNSGGWTKYTITDGASSGTYFLTIPNGPSDNKRLQIDRDLNINMVEDTRNGTWESFRITEVGSSSSGGGTTVTGCDLPYTRRDFEVTNRLVNHTSEAIDISCASSVNISMDLTSVPNMETADYLNIYYRVDGGSLQVLSENVDSFSAKTVSKSGIRGNSLQLVYQSLTNVDAETYTVSNIQVSGSSNKNVELIPSEVRLFPNPVVSTATIEGAKDATLVIYDLNGAVVFNGVISSESEVVDFSALATGIYYGEVNGNGDKSILKLIKN